MAQILLSVNYRSFAADQKSGSTWHRWYIRRLETPLHQAAGAWVDELPAVLWSIRTTTNRSTGFTHFFLVYGAEAVLPTDMIHNSPRVATYVEEDAEEARQDGLDTLEEGRELALQ